MPPCEHDTSDEYKPGEKKDPEVTTPKKLTVSGRDD
jgi:hypothetical protein